MARRRGVDRLGQQPHRHLRQIAARNVLLGQQPCIAPQLGRGQRRVRQMLDGLIGRSAEGRPLRHARWGKGKIRVLLWSQMHGDESTGTMALADLFRFLGEHPRHPLVQRLRANTTLHVLPMLNPDGAMRFQRRNAQGIDINRDARNLATPEGRALKALHDRVRPAFGFNLHDQQPHYRVGDSDRSTAIALTGTGSQTVTLPPMHSGKFTLQLVKVTGTVINGEIGTDGKLIAPITVG